ncbi:MAG: phosphopyruvate hydratase [Bacilli bacterium]
MKIKNIVGREILDSRGNPTVEVDVVLLNNVVGRVSVPSGASTGIREAIELRDGDMTRYLGKGVLQAVNNVNTVIRSKLVGMDVENQEDLDRVLIELDGTSNKKVLGANAILGVSLGCLKASSINKREMLSTYVGEKISFPSLMINILNGGMHADNNLAFQEFLIIPMQNTVREKLRVASEVFHTLKAVLKEKGLGTGVGDEGGFAPNLLNNEEGFLVIMEAIERAGYKGGIDIKLGVDVAASSFYENGKYRIDDKLLTPDELIEYYEVLCDKYPLVSIEDPFMEDDFESFAKLTELLGNRIQLVGDDFFVTNIKYLQKGIDMKAGNAILIKPNQIGTYSEMLKTIMLAKNNGYKTIISHRSGETEDVIIADLAVGLDIGQIKTGSMSRGERISKYNELMRLEDVLTRK